MRRRVDDMGAARPIHVAAVIESRWSALGDRHGASTSMVDAILSILHITSSSSREATVPIGGSSAGL